MIEDLDRLKKEWPTIKRAPFSFLIALVICAGAIYAGLYFHFNSKLADDELSVTHWRNESDFWKERTENLEKTTPVPVSCPTAPVEKSVPAENKKPVKPVPTVDQHGRNNISQIGNQNSAQIYEGPPVRNLSEEQSAAITKVLSGSNFSITIGTVINDSEAAKYGMTIADAFEKAGWTVERVIGRQMQSGYSPEAINLSLYAPVGATSVNNEAAVRTMEAFKAAGIKVSVNPDSTMEHDKLNLFIGASRTDYQK